MLAKKFNIRISWLNVSPNNNSLCMIKLQEDFNFISDRTLAAYQDKPGKGGGGGKGLAPKKI